MKLNIVALSPWFPPDEEFKPVNIGQYRTRIELKNGSRMKSNSIWDGKRWTDISTGAPLYYQDQEWQGLARTGPCKSSPIDNGGEE